MFIVIFCITEAINAILQHSPTAESVLRRRIVKTEILYRYLHKRGAPVISKDKHTLVREILLLWQWDCSLHEEVNMSCLEFQ